MKFNILFILLLFITSCNQIAVISKDGVFGGHPPHDTTLDTIPIPTDTIPQDTFNTDTLPLVLDTCLSYQELVNTKFSTWAANLDGLLPGGYEFVYRPENTDIPIDIDSFFNQFGQSKTYFSGINLFGIVTGYDNPSWVVQHSLYVKDLFGSYFLIYLNPYNFSTRGALTPDQFIEEVVLHSNLHRIDFWNCGNFTCDQYLQVIDYFIDNCIDGHGNIFDLRHIPMSCNIGAERIAKLKLAGFNVLPQQFNAPPPFIRA